MKIYLAGPMTGIADWNFPKFHATAANLRAAGHEVVNPAENFGGRTDLPWSDYLREAVRQVTTCDIVAVLPGWACSRGATLEVHVARTLGMSIHDADTLTVLL